MKTTDPIPGIDVALLARDDHGDLVLHDDGTPTLVTEPDHEGDNDQRRKRQGDNVIPPPQLVEDNEQDGTEHNREQRLGNGDR